MFKYFLSIFVLLCAIAFSFISCEKREHFVSDNEHWAQEIPNAQKTGTLFSIGTLCGHTVSECGGNCLPPPYSGHVDCQGYGRHCTMAATVLVVPATSSLYTATTQDSTDLTSEEFFNMPARSLYTGMDETGTPRWLNIPAQLSIRDSVTRLFTFNSVHFTNYQEYKNQ